MTKFELVKLLRDRYPDIQLKEANIAVNIFFDSITKALAEGRRVELRGFGAFSLRHRKARVARNPKNGEKVNLPARKAVYFRAGKVLKNMIN